jgi:hypothetical protein
MDYFFVKDILFYFFQMEGTWQKPSVVVHFPDSLFLPKDYNFASRI